MPNSNVELELALSIKQPWATLVLLGIKTIEIRQWSTPLRGRIYLHAGKVADDRPQGWALVPEAHKSLTDLRGGVIGSVEITGCLTYASARDFAKNAQLHRNAPSWYRAPRLFGFTLNAPRAVPFYPCPGQVKFFPVTLPEKLLKPTKAPPARKKVVKFEM